MNIHRQEQRYQKRGQITLEYAIMIAMIIAAAIVAGRMIIRPSMNRLYIGAGTLINSSAQALDGGATGVPTTPPNPTTPPDPTTPPNPGGGGGGGGCFLGGTKVLLSDGTSKPIEEIKKGDEVLGYDGKQVKAGKVAKVFFHPKEKGYRVISTEDGQTINVTDIHRLFNGKTYVAASRFKAGDNLFLLKDNKLQAVKIKSITEKKDSVNDVYNLNVKKWHNYFAEGILCHNDKMALEYTQ
jgi:ribosomal 50S subunit-recycling heat shock protein